MSIRKNNIKIRQSQENISYYNEIAGNYDAILAEDHINEQVRQKVSAIFCQVVPSGTVLDFGGGTGSDLEWLTRQQYSIIFCEPATYMRQKAIDHNNSSLYNTGIIFLDDNNADFRNWQTRPPFSQKADAVLLNFAVLNCIPDVGSLFENLSLVTRAGAHLFALILNNGLKKRCKTNLRGTLLSLFNGKTIGYDIYYKGHRQQVFIHSTRAIKKNSTRYFSFKEIRLVPGTGFSLIHLIKR